MKYLLSFVLLAVAALPAPAQDLLSRVKQLEDVTAANQAANQARFDRIDAKLASIEKTLAATSTVQVAQTVQPVAQPVTDAVIYQYLAQQGSSACSNGSCGSSGVSTGRVGLFGRRH